MTRRNRTQEEHAIFEEQTSTHIQMIVSEVEASNKELEVNKNNQARKRGNKSYNT